MSVLPNQRPGSEAVAETLYLNLGLLYRRLRQNRLEGALPLPESSALKRLESAGPATVTELAKAEQISVQSMGATLAALESKGLVERRPDPADGRRAVISISAGGITALGERRNARTRHLAEIIADRFDDDELAVLVAAAPLLERLAESL